MKIISSETSVDAPVFIWGEEKSHDQSAEQLFEAVKKLTGKPFSIASFSVTDWNGQFSPWKAPAVFGNEDFAGNAGETLKYLETQILPEIKKTFSKSKIFLAGYSLAGLFSLWALYESAAFNGAVCCSSSLWFPGWDEYAATHEIKNPASIYMSLGNREEKTRNKIMASVGERTEKQKALLVSSSKVERFVFEWNEGGHFSEPLLRLAKGIAGILNV